MPTGEQLQRIDAQVCGCCCGVANRLLVLNIMLLQQLIMFRLHMASRSVALLMALVWLLRRLQADGMAAAVSFICGRAMALTPFLAVWSCLVV